MKKKVLALFLAVVMMITALPFNAFALSYGTAEENADRTIGLNFCGFASGATSYDGDGDGKVSDAEKLAEIEAVLEDGYINQSFLPLNDNLEETVALYIENGVDFWISLGRFFSSRETVEHYINDAEYWVNRIRAAGGYDNLLGFWWDEPLWNGMSNDDMYAITKALYEKWGKRNYIVEVPQVIAVKEGNITYNGVVDPNVEGIYDSTLTYITDIGFDNYSWDVRSAEEIGDGAYDNQIDAMALAKDEGTGHANYDYTLQELEVPVDYDSATGKYSTARGFYLYVIDTMCKRIEGVQKDMYVWFYPASYTTSTYTGGKADEAYCNAHFNFFKEQLLAVESSYTYAKAGGLTLYSYGSYSGNDATKGTADDSVGLNAKLPITVGEDTLYSKMVGTKPYDDGTNGAWNTLAATILAAKTAFDNTDTLPFAALDTNVPFGSLDVVDVDSSSITINAVAGYEYTINAGTYDSATGKFTGLEAETSYTITVTRTADSAAKTFDVTTTALSPYASGMDDTASYILKMPSNLQHMHTDYGWPSTPLSQNATGDGWYVSSSSGKRIDGGYIPIVNDGGEYFLNFKLDSNRYEHEDGTVQDYTNSDGNTSVSLSLGDINRGSKDAGLDDTICPDTVASNLKYFAYRFKADAGSEGQVSKFDLYLNMTTDTGTFTKRTERAGSFDLMYLDKSTLTLSKMDFVHGITLTEQAYDGWLIIPFDAYTDIDGLTTTSNLDNIVEYMTSYQLFMHHHTDAETYCTHVAGTATTWDDRTLKLGDVMVLEDVNAFVERKQSANVTTENEKNILTVPVDNPITFNPSAALLYYRNNGPSTGVYGYFWGITRYNNPNFMYRGASQTIGGEQFFSYYVEEDDDGYNYKEKLNADGTKSVADRWYTLFLPANYTLGVNFGATSSNVASYPSTSRGGALYGEQTISTLYSDAADYNYVAFRLMTSGGKDGETSPVAIHIGTSVTPIDLTGTAVINYNDATTTTIESGTAIDLPSNFDGWIVVPSDKIASATRAGFVFLKDDDYSWYGQTIYHGNIKIVKDLDTFKDAHGIPEFRVDATNTSVAIICEDETALFSLDQINWYTAAELNAQFAATEITVGTKYTVYSKNADAVNAAIAETTFWTIADTAKNILTVPSDSYIFYNNAGWDKPEGAGYYWGLTRWSTTETATAPFHGQSSVDVNGEYMFKTEVTEEQACQPTYLPATYELNVNFNATADNTAEGGTYAGQLYGSQPLSALYSDAADYSYIAIRQKIVGDTETPAYIHVGTSNANGAKCDWQNIVLINYTDSSCITIAESGTTYNIPANFDGWIIVPESQFSSTAMEDVVTVGFRYLSNTNGKTFYQGDMKIFKDLEAFVQVHFTPSFDVTSGATSLTVSSDVIASENIRYSLDKIEWLDATAFNAKYGVDSALDYDAEYTVYAKYETAADDSVTAKTVWTAPYSTHRDDGGHYFLNVYDDITKNPYIAYSKSQSPAGVSELGWPSSVGTLCKKYNDETKHNAGQNNSALYLREFDGETFIEFDKAEVYPEGAVGSEDADGDGVKDSIAGQPIATCVNQTILPDAITYGAASTSGIHSSIDRTNLTHIAIRLKIEDENNKKSGFYLYLNGRQATSTFGTAYTIDKATGAISTPDSWKSKDYIFTGAFDGWVVFPIDVYGKDNITNGSSTGALSIVPYMHNGAGAESPCHDSNTYSLDGWDDKILYLGDILLLEGDEKFKAAHTKPDFEVEADNNSITVTDEYEDGVALYSVDQKTWLTKTEFNKATNRKSFVEHTVTAIFANAADKSFITSKKVWTLSDTAKNILTVPAEGGSINYNQGTNFGLTRWTTSEKVLKNGSLYYDAALVEAGKSFYQMHSVTINGENFFDVEVSPSVYYSVDQTADVQKVSFLPGTYSTTAKYGDSIAISELYDDVDDYNYVGVRLKKVSNNDGVISQLKINSDGSNAVSLAGTVLVNYATGETTTYTSSDSYVTLENGFDGWLFVPKATLKATLSELTVFGLMLYDISATSNWDNLHLYVGDIQIVKEIESFKRVHFYPEFDVTDDYNKVIVSNETDAVKSVLYSVDGKNWLGIDAFNKVTREFFTNYTVYAKYPNAQAKNIVSKTVWTLEDSKNIFTVPSNNYIYYNNAGWDKPEGTGYYWGLARWNTTDTTTAKFHGQSSVDVNGEYMFKTEVTAEQECQPTYLPVTYELNVCYDATADNTAAGGTKEGELYGIQPISALYSDAADYNYIAIRQKIVGDTETPTYLHIGTSHANGAKCDWQNVVLINFTDSSCTTIAESGTTYSLPANFDGWIIVPESQFYSSIAMENVTNVGFRYLSNTNGKTFYQGDMKILKDVNDFVSTLLPPEFDVTVNEDSTKFVLTNEADTANRTVYSIDNTNWYGIDYINAITLEKDYIYTIKAKYPWSDDVVSKEVKTSYYSSGLEDGASYFMNVYDDSTAHPYLGYAVGLTGKQEIGWPSGSATFCKNAEGTHTATRDASANGARLFLREFTDARGNKETFIELDRNEEVSGCVNQTVLADTITYGSVSTSGLHSSIDKTNLKYMAIRIKIEDENNKTSGFYLYINGRQMSSTLGTAYMIDNATGAISTPNTWKRWNCKSYIFEGAFDGWVVIPLDIYGKDKITNGSDAGSLSITAYVHSEVGDETGHDVGTGGDQYALEGWDDKILYIGDMLVLEDDDLFVKTRYCANGLHNLEDVAAVEATADVNGTVEHKHCSVCGKNFDAEGNELATIVSEYADVTFQNASLTLDANTAVNFKADGTALTEGGYTDVKAEFTIEGVEGTVVIDAPLDENGDLELDEENNLVFTFDDVPAEMMSNTITATLKANDANGNECSNTIEYSVKEYCYNILEKYEVGTTDYEEDTEYADAFKKVIVDLLYYGSYVQTLTGTNTDKLVKDDLTRDQKALASAEIPEMKGLKGIYTKSCADDKATWVSANLNFHNNVRLKFNFATEEDVADYKVVISSDKAGENVLATITNDEFVKGKTEYAVYFNELTSVEMNKTVYVTVYNGDTQVSDILAYTISAYAREKYRPEDPNDNLSNVVLAMMKYGDAAVEFKPLNDAKKG